MTMADNKVTKVTVNTSNGLENLFTKQEGEAQEIIDARDSGFAGVTIELAADKTYTVSQTFTTTSFKGILKGESKETTTITLTGGNGLFAQIGEYGSGPENNGTVENITFNVQTDITDTYSYDTTTTAGAVAGQNNGTIQNCDVTINAGGSITANGNSNVYAGGIAGENRGKIIGCKVKGSYKGTGANDSADSVDISVDSSDFNVFAGGIAGCNRKTGTVEDCSVTKCKIEAGKSGNIVAAGGIVGLNESGDVADITVTGCYITATFSGLTVTVPNDDDLPTDSTNGLASVYAGTKIGYDSDTNEPVG